MRYTFFYYDNKTFFYLVLGSESFEEMRLHCINKKEPLCALVTGHLVFIFQEIWSLELDLLRNFPKTSLRDSLPILKVALTLLRNKTGIQLG